MKMDGKAPTNLVVVKARIFTNYHGVVVLAIENESIWWAGNLAILVGNRTNMGTIASSCRCKIGNRETTK